MCKDLCTCWSSSVLHPADLGSRLSDKPIVQVMEGISAVELPPIMS
jgi:hypothetical protein